MHWQKELDFNALNFGKPKYPADLLHLQNPHGSMGLRTSDDPSQLEVPKATSGKGSSEKAFSYIAPRLLNRLPASLKEMGSITTFKSKLKTFMFARTFGMEWNIEFRPKVKHWDRARTFDLSYQSVNEGLRL